MIEKFSVTGMTCSSCSAHVEKAVQNLDGVNKVNVNLLSNNMSVDYDNNKTNSSKIIEAVTVAGYSAATFKGTSNKSQIHQPENLVIEQLKSMKIRLLVSLIFFVPLMYVSMGHMVGLPLPQFLSGLENSISFAMTQFLLTLPVMYVNRKYYQVGFKTLARRSPNMDSLIAIGSLAAVVYGIFAIYKIGYGLGIGDMDIVAHYHMDLYFESAATILTLITLGKYLETRSKGKTSEAISKLMDLAPKTATVYRNKAEIEIPVGDVEIGDIVIIKPGQSIPVDGVIIDGNSSVDQSALTGESIPVEKNPGDKVIAATINKSGYFRFEAKKVGDDTTLAQIIQLVEDAGNSKAPIAKLADKISGVFVPVVILISLLATITWILLGHPFEFALSIGIAVLVISCPCALGLATPVAIMVGTGKGAEKGILIKSAEALETAHSIQTVVLDKTGTITKGKPVVTDLLVATNQSENHLIEIATSLEKTSEHPLSEAIVEYASKKGIYPLKTTEFQSFPGRGISAKIGQKICIAGNLAFMQENNISTQSWESQSDSLAENGKTPLYFAEGSELLGIIAVADVVKPDSQHAINELKNMGIEVIMLTGDNKKTAEAIRRQLSIDRVVAEVLPQDKEREIRAIQDSGKKVAMVGDGINDAPALVRADVGIAIGAGTDIAIESADIVLMKSNLTDVVTAIQLSKSVIRNIKMNLFWAFFYNSIGIPLAAGLFYTLLGWKLNPMFAAAAMSMSSVCVVTNALRLKLFKPKFSNPVPMVAHTEPEIIKEDDNTMKKIIKVEGMHCPHCQATVEKVLSGLDGVSSAKVDLNEKTATISITSDISNDLLIQTVNDAGFQAISVTEKKGLFGK